MKKPRMIPSSFTKTTKDIGMYPKKKNPGNSKVSFSGLSSSNQSSLTLMISSPVKIGTLKWVFHTKEAIFCMDLQALVKALSLKPLLLKSSTQSALSTVPTKSTISTSIAS